MAKVNVAESLRSADWYAVSREVETEDEAKAAKAGVVAIEQCGDMTMMGNGPIVALVGFQDGKLVARWPMHLEAGETITRSWTVSTD